MPHLVMAKGKASNSPNTIFWLAIIALVLIAGYFIGSTTPVQTTKKASEAMAPRIYKFDLAQQNRSGETGFVSLLESGNSTVVVVDLNNTPRNSNHPAHIHFGSCEDLGSIAYSLESVVDGTSTTVLDGVSLDTLMAQGSLAVNAHQSVEKIANYVACGDLDF